MPPSASDEYERVTARDRAEWRAWLVAHHASAAGVWLTFYRKGSGQPSVSLDEAVEEALCFGWVDSKLRRLDSERYILTFSPRKRKSPWSKSNKERVARLTAQGLMAPAGLAAVEAAQRDGAWTVYDGIEDLQVPDDLAAALAADPDAERHFAAFNASTRQRLLWWVASAKRPETRQRRIAQIVAEAAHKRDPLATPPRDKR